MNVFLSWSGEKSHAVAALLHAWLPRLVPGAKPWMSASDIPSGARWTEELTMALRSSEAALVLLAASNHSNPWLLYEAGVLSAVCGSGRLTPILLDLPTQSVPGPLSHFQSVQCDLAGVDRLVASLRAQQSLARAPSPHSVARARTNDVATLVGEIVATMAKYPPPPKPRPAVRYITRSEMTILEFLGAGKSARQIAHEMGVSQSTIRTLLANLRSKFQANSVAQLIHYAREEGLLDTSEA